MFGVVNNRQEIGCRWYVVYVCGMWYVCGIWYVICVVCSIW